MPAQGSQLSLGDFLCFSLYATGHAFTRAYAPLLAPHGLTYPQYITLVALWEHDDRTVGELGQTLSLEFGTLSPLLKRMETAKLITRSRVPSDERVVRLRLAERGETLRKTLARVPDCMIASVGMDEAQIARLAAQIGEVKRALDRVAAARIAGDN